MQQVLTPTCPGCLKYHENMEVDPKAFMFAVLSCPTCHRLFVVNNDGDANSTDRKTMEAAVDVLQSICPGGD